MLSDLATRKRSIAAGLLAAIAAAFIACTAHGSPGSQSADWGMTGGDYDDTHFSPLEQINADNVGKLGLAWSLDLPGEVSLEAIPIAVGGTLYFSGSYSAVYAVDGVTGKQLWRYDPENYKQDARRLRLTFSANRGVAYEDGRVFVGTLDGRLIALDAKTGTPLWTVRTFPLESRRTILGVPRVYDGKVIIGNGGGDYGERGYITAYDTKTGKELWRFYTVPGTPEENAADPTMAMIAKTWNGEYWKTGTGGTVWHAMTFDRELNRLYVGVGNSGPYNPAERSPGNGDNLFLVSIVAIDATTGKYIWHYQLNPREAWDFKATADITLANLTIDGRRRKVLMQAPTNGFFYVVDRTDGKVISAEKLGKVTWAERIDLKTGRPVEAPNIRYENGEALFWPSPFGTHNWHAMSFSPRTGLVYIPYMQLGARFKLDPAMKLGGVQMGFVVEDKDDGKGKLLAWDPVAQKARWSIPRPTLWNGGLLSTAGNLVFQGMQEGTFEARDARDGKLLWQFDAGLGIIGAPMSYAVGGKQYVSILVGHGGSASYQASFHVSGWKYGQQPRRLLTFVLNGNGKLEPAPPRDFVVHALDDPKLVLDPAKVAAGGALFAQKNCIACHGGSAIANGAPGPDLRESGVALDRAAFDQVLRDGSLAANGMPLYDDITPAEADAIYAYIRQRARDALSGRKDGGEAGGKF